MAGSVLLNYPLGVNVRVHGALEWTGIPGGAFPTRAQYFYHPYKKSVTHRRTHTHLISGADAALRTDGQ